jgi:TfoX/Sxy family transcriptional regulator of competence genes
MSHFGQVVEDPEYYDDADQAWDDSLELDDEFEDSVDFITELERFNPFNTVNS